MASPLADTLDALAQRLAETAQALRSGNLSLETDMQQRMGLIAAGTDLIDAVSLPHDKVLLWLPQFTHITSIRLFIKWKAFEKIPTGDGADTSYAELAAQLGADVSLITRIARPLVANGTLKQTGADRIAHTTFSAMLATPNSIWAMVQLAFDDQLSSYVAMPRYFDRFGLAAEPMDRLQSVLAFSEGRLGATVWEIANSSEQRLRVFMLAMAAVEEQLPAIGDYDLGWAVQEASRSADRALVVDVGGGKGQALKGIFRATPGLPRHRCVLEDLPEVVEAAGRDDAELAGVQMVAVDFFKEQPVKGALVYYIRRCLHDYSDEECVKILRHISSAMVADSRLLIVEMLLGDRPSALQAAMDMAMLTLSGKERTLANFEDITGRAALKITKVSEIPGGSAVIECALA
ncbi:O-methyltransferase-domain-containing protein [Chaetomium strumarium]|uniref:O-methyltransferase-domain-containing protein n=1 Tax=Chaetomium strumarium TaxID=1170767 RepID=A0AAJ0GZZ4_9PEZI|nr:O-methyltransferase-domain-containing protein [Chaetomium strumarium]